MKIKLQGLMSFKVQSQKAPKRKEEEKDEKGPSKTMPKYKKMLNI